MHNLDEIGSIYKIFIDPILKPLRMEALQLVSENSKIIDIACGTGAFALEMSKKAHQVVGIDLSDSQIRTALKSQKKLKVSNVEFKIKDASDLSEFADKEFDLATISLALHQFPTQVALQIFKEIIRISKEIIIVDYAFPLSPGFYKTSTYAIERIAGKAHYQAFKSYMNNGGTKWYIDAFKLGIDQEISKRKKIFTIIKCKA